MPSLGTITTEIMTLSFLMLGVIKELTNNILLMIKQNAFSIREYWISKYEGTFKIEYISDKRNIELALFKALINRYNYYLVLEATDRFFATIKKEKATILLFASKKFFESSFGDLTKEIEVVEYYRLLPWYSEENQATIKDLTQAYRNYSHALSLSQEDIDNMNIIVKRLKDIPIEKGA